MLTDQRYMEYLNSLLSGNRIRCEQMLKSVIGEGVSLGEIYENLIQRSMYDVGTLWENNKISVATEHLCTAITENLLHLTYPLLFSAPRLKGKAVISCAPNEYHQLGARIVADYITYKGWDCRFLGANTPQEDLVHFLEQEKPVFLGLSAGTESTLIFVGETSAAVRNKFPNMDIIAGGQAFADADALPAGSFRHLATLRDLDAYLESVI